MTTNNTEIELPEAVDIQRMMTQAVTLTGTVALSRLSRLNDVNRPIAPLAAQLAFAPDERHGIRVTGRVKTRLAAICQRCLQPMELAISAKINAVVLEQEQQAVTSEEDQQEYVLALNGELRLVDFLEEEVLLCCPMIPTHGFGECDPPIKTADPGVPAERKRPFEGLDELLNRK